MPSVVIVGGGPRGTGVLERLAASAPELLESHDPIGHGLEVHLVDPYPPGAGRIWRHDQSPLLWMNSMAGDVTMFTDDSVRIDGPIVPGPTLYDWAVAVRSGELPGERVPDGPVGDELRGLEPSTFATRRLQSHYLEWVLRRTIADLPPGVRVHVHRTRAVGLAAGDEIQDSTPIGQRSSTRGNEVRLATGTTLPADVLVLASGHLDAEPTADEQELVTFAERHGVTYLPPEQTTDSDLSVIPPGETVIARGMGLAFIDLVVLLFEGRGGRFVEGSGDTLDYVPSGAEPLLHVGSGRGVPYHAKTEYSLRGPRPPLPRFLGPDEVAGFVERGNVDLRTDVWPLIAKEVGWAHYHELFHGHPDRVDGGWEAFDRRYAELDWYSAEREALVAGFVPDEADRLDFERIDRPLADASLDLSSLQERMRSYIADDLHRHVDRAHTAELGAFVGLLSVYGQVAELAGSDALTPRSRAHDLAWWHNLFSSLASGPPGVRLRQLLALSRAGYVTFLGAGLWVEADDDAGVFRAGGTSLGPTTGAPVEARTFVEARLPAPSLSRTIDPMLGALYAAGRLDEEVLRVTPPDSGPIEAADGAAEGSGQAVVLHNTGLVRVRTSDFRMVDNAGRPHPRRFAIGPHTTVRLPGAFTRPNTNALSFRANDALARAALSELARAERRAA